MNGGDFGRFINPTDDDDQANMLYESSSVDFYSRVSVASKTLTSIQVTDFPGVNNVSNGGIYSISSVRANPNVSNRVYLGFNNGTVYRVNNANTGTTNTASLVFIESFAEGRYVSCIEIENGNENHIIITLSNFGVTSLYETQNGNSATPSWQSVEGDLPDMPVRWAMINPANSDQVAIATELGVWVTANLHGASTSWIPMNTGLASSRIDMVKYRASDNRVFAASHGRGLYTSDDLVSTCLQELLTLSSFMDNTTYDDAFEIQSSAVMNKNNLTLKAEGSISLLNAFEVTPNKVFNALIDDCSNH